MLDPILQQELLETKEEEKEIIEIPEDLNKPWTIELIKEANEFAIGKFKEMSYMIVS